jgi:hypothetical protein
MRTPYRSVLSIRSAVISTIGASFFSLQAVCAQEINTLFDAWGWYETAGGLDARAGSGVIKSIKRGNYGWCVDKYLLNDVESSLAKVSRSASSGKLAAGKKQVKGLRDIETIVGSLALDANYTSTWTATAWKKNKRTVTAEVKVKFKFKDRWDFEENENYNLLENLVFEKFPAFLVGDGTPYYIYGDFTDTFKVSVAQRK